MAAFHVPPFVFFVRCGGEAVFFVCSEDYPEVIYQNVNLLIPTLCGLIIRVFVRIRWKIRDSRAASRKRNVCPLPVFFRYCDGYKCVSCAKWKVEREFFGYPGLQNDSTVWYAVSFRLDEKAVFYAVHRLVGSSVFRRQAHAVASA